MTITERRTAQTVLQTTNTTEAQVMLHRMAARAEAASARRKARKLAKLLGQIERRNAVSITMEQFWTAARPGGFNR